MFQKRLREQKGALQAHAAAEGTRGDRSLEEYEEDLDSLPSGGQGTGRYRGTAKTYTGPR